MSGKAMANYYHEARAEKRAIKEKTEANKRKAERRAELAGVEAEQPFDLLRVDGRSCKLFRNEEQRQAVESMEGMLPWNGKDDNLIDRFDGRALLDFYREPDARTRNRPKSDEELELEELLAFEAFRDLVKTAGQSEAAGLAAALEENLELRAVARAAANDGAGLTAARQRGPISSPATPAGFGAYGAVGFSYGGETTPMLPPPPRPGAANDSDEYTDSESDSEDDAPKTLNEQEREAFAAGFGIMNFDSTLRRAERNEKAEAEGRVPKPKRPFSRKKYAQRAKRMAGQGLQPPSGGLGASSSGVKSTPRPGAATPYAYRASRRGSPSYEEDGRFRDTPWNRGRDESRSPSPAEPRTQYITSFSAQAPARHRSAAAPGASRLSCSIAETQAAAGIEASKRADNHRELLPSRTDQESGPYQLPAEANTLRGVSADDYWAKQREAERTARYEQRRKEREKEKLRELRKQPLSAVKPAAAKGSETPQERLKRLMAAQINKQQARDTVSVRQRQQVEARDAAARRQIERAAMSVDTRYSPSPSPRHHGRSRSRSYSPQRYRRSRSRSRSRSPRRPDQYAPHSPRPSPGGLHLPLIMSNAIDACSCCRCLNRSSFLWNIPWRRWPLVLLVPACHTCDNMHLSCGVGHWRRRWGSSDVRHRR